MKKYVLAAVATLGLLGPAMAQSQADAEDDETACLIGKAAVFLQSREGDDIDARLVAEYATEYAYSVCPSGALSGRSHAYVVGAIEALAEGSFEKADDAEQRDLPIFFRGGWCRTADDPGAPGDSVFERQQRGQQCPLGDALTITRVHLNGMLAGKALNCRVEVSTSNKNGHWVRLQRHEAALDALTRRGQAPHVGISERPEMRTDGLARRRLTRRRAFPGTGNDGHGRVRT